MADFVSDVTRFIFLCDDPEPADIVFVPGNGHAEPAERAASLFLQGYAPVVLPSGHFAKGLAQFAGQTSGTRPYPGDFRTEWDFMRAVLLANGVPDSAILREDRATFTYENAIRSRNAADAAGIAVHRALLCCMPVHARRAKAYYEALFPEAKILVCPAQTGSPTREDWMTTPEGIDAVLNELARCGSQFHAVLRDRLLGIPDPVRACILPPTL